MALLSTNNNDVITVSADDKMVFNKDNNFETRITLRSRKHLQEFPK